MSISIIAFDIATKTGWASNNSSGVWDLKIRRDESGGLRLLKFRAKLIELFKLEEPDLIVFELTAGRHKGAIIVQSELHGVLKTLCEDNKIQYRSYAATEIKKHATNVGNCGKPAMLEAACKKWPEVKWIDDNHVDAYWLLDLAQRDWSHV